ncbi:unnamed protein product, partial [Musa hybrid cultivar]
AEIHVLDDQNQHVQALKVGACFTNYYREQDLRLRSSLSSGGWSSKVKEELKGSTSSACLPVI